MSTLDFRCPCGAVGEVWQEATTRIAHRVIPTDNYGDTTEAIGETETRGDTDDVYYVCYACGESAEDATTVELNEAGEVVRAWDEDGEEVAA